MLSYATCVKLMNEWKKTSLKVFPSNNWMRDKAYGGCIALI